MNILAIETSCDETAVSIVKDGKEILSNIVASQIDIHRDFGGVVPEIASRKHLEIINYCLVDSLKEANLNYDDIDYIAVTQGPGLIGSLLVGVSYAKSLAYSLNKKLIPINHIEGHIYANFLEHNNIEFPLLATVISGGHTHIFYMKNHMEYELVAKTVDDAVGEAFDKVSKFLELGYPGGPIIEKLSANGNENAIDFPVAKVKKNPMNFSFSGLKTAVINYYNKTENKTDQLKADIVASFQKNVANLIANRLFKINKDKRVKTILLAGGVAANKRIRQAIQDKFSKYNVRVIYPSIKLCTDNAAMIATAAYYRKDSAIDNYLDMNAVSRMSL